MQLVEPGPASEGERAGQVSVGEDLNECSMDDEILAAGRSTVDDQETGVVRDWLDCGMDSEGNHGTHRVVSVLGK